MRDLKINPSNFEISLREENLEKAVDRTEISAATVCMIFGDQSVEQCIDAKEAAAIGKWFSALALRLKQFDKRANKIAPQRESSEC